MLLNLLIVSPYVRATRCPVLTWPMLGDDDRYLRQSPYGERTGELSRQIKCTRLLLRNKVYRAVFFLQLISVRFAPGYAVKQSVTDAKSNSLNRGRGTTCTKTFAFCD
eukprot:1777219-Rhodomonas_salina.1